MGKDGAAGAVAHRINAFDRRAQPVVGLDVAVHVRLQVRIFNADVVAVRNPANTEKQRFAVAPGLGAIGVGAPDVKTQTVVRCGSNSRVVWYGHARTETFHKNTPYVSILAVQE